MSVDTIPPLDLLEALSYSLGVWHNYVANAGFVPGGGPSLTTSTRVLGASRWGVFLVVITIILSVTFNVLALNLLNGPPWLFAPSQSLP